jgi:ABC-type cobalamin transport system permease subunit
MIWLTVSLTAAYALIIAIAFQPAAGASSKAFDLLVSEVLFAGPLIATCILSILMARVGARNILLFYAVAYSILTAITFYWTFGFEHDAQYQLMLLLIPMFGFPSVVAAGLIAAMTR